MEHFILAQFGLGGAESVLRAIFFFIITIFVLVTVHEFGHFIAGRIFGMRVPVFSIGMGRRIIGFNKINGITTGPLDPEAESKLENHTDYRISILPTGGYARISGMIDETQQNELPEEVQPWEFRAKPWWQKSIVISAGVIMNTLLAWGIFAGRNIISGSEGWATTTVGYVAPGSVSADKGIQAGDKIISIDHDTVTTWQGIEKKFTTTIGQGFALQLERDGKPYTTVFTSALGTIQNASHDFGLEPAGLSSIIDSVIPSNPAAKAGILAGDTVVAVDGKRVFLPDTLIAEINSHALKPVTLEIHRHSADTTLAITPDAAGKIGVMIGANFSGATTTIHYGLGEAIGLGWTNLWTVVRLSLYGIGEVIKGKLPISNMGGPVKIAALASKSAQGGFESFIMFMALLSISLALINIFPIPALDGGHLIIILIETAIGHELSQKFKLNFLRIGIAIILFFLIYITISDIRTL